MSNLAIVAAILPAAAWWWANPSLLRLQYRNRVRMRSIIPVPTAKHGPTRPLRLSKCPPANDRDLRIAPTPQSSFRRHFSAADTDLTCHRQACPERSTAYDARGAYTVDLTDISHGE
jgi:hypothetical protein